MHCIVDQAEQIMIVAAHHTRTQGSESGGTSSPTVATTTDSRAETISTEKAAAGRMLHGDRGQVDMDTRREPIRSTA